LYFVACAYDGVAKAGAETPRHPLSANDASVTPLTFIFLTQWVGALCLRTGLMMDETAAKANPPRTVWKNFGSGGAVALLQQAIQAENQPRMPGIAMTAIV